MTATSYELGRHADRCAHTGEPLTPGEPYVAALVERAEEEGFDRVGLSAAAWDSGARPDRLFAAWRTRLPLPNEKPRLFIDDDALLAIFDQLEDDDDRRRRAFRHLLALVLIRKRLLIQAGRRAGSGEREAALLVKRRGGGPDAPVSEVVEPELTADSLAGVTDQLRAVLDPDAAASD